LIKLSEKYDNARTIDLLPEEKKLRVASRLLDIYAPLAEFMNLTDAKREFQLHGFRVLYPDEYETIADWMHRSQNNIHENIEQVRALLEDITQIVKVDGQIWGRVKSYFSIWRKQFKHGKEGKQASIESLNDLLAFTIMVDTVDQCYAVAYALKDYGNVSDIEFEDYIRSPKPNGFSEIQLICHFSELVNINTEVQVLTKEMYWHNTYGPASHIAYKLEERRHSKKSTEFQWVEMVHQEIEKSKEYSDLVESRPMRFSLFNNSIFVFTPKHKVIELPKGATAIDFAYQVHTAVGHSANFARVNGETVTLSKVLNSGDVVEVTTDPKKKLPTEGWLLFAKTKTAQSLIKSGLRRKLRVAKV
jgi:GTP pyrophosphokinase